MRWIVIGAAGKMGKIVCELLRERHEEFYEIDVESVDFFEQADIIVDFSTAESREKYIKFALEQKIPYACFSTGINIKDREMLEKLSDKVPVLMCSNASVGAQTMFEITKIASQMMPQAEIVLQEYHHKHKKDSPSGTAKILLEILKNHKVDSASFRVGNEVGIHKVQFYLNDEVLEISHRANARSTFACGAIEMATKLVKKEKGLYKSI